jgi:hypothetical protein
MHRDASPMNIRVEWDNAEQTVVRYIFEQRWTWEDFFNAVNTAKTLIDAAPAQGVGVIMDGKTRNMQFPPNMLTHFKTALRNKHPKTRIVVVVHDNAFLRVMINTLVILSGSNGQTLQVVDDLEKAREIVRERLSQPMTE